MRDIGTILEEKCASNRLVLSEITFKVRIIYYWIHILQLLCHMRLNCVIFFKSIRFMWIGIGRRFIGVVYMRFDVLYIITRITQLVCVTIRVLVVLFLSYVLDMTRKPISDINFRKALRILKKIKNSLNVYFSSTFLHFWFP